LRRAGHDVYTPTLTGFGERVHLATPETNLSTHIRDIVNVIEYEDLHDIVLAGFSYGGMVVTGVADRMPERIAHLVYIDAVLPGDGQSMLDVTGSIGGPGTRIEGWRVLPPPIPDGLPPEVAHRMARLTPAPRLTAEEKVSLSAPLEERAFTRTYIEATNVPNRPRDWAGRSRDNPRWRFLQLRCGHLVYDEMPEELAGILLDVAQP
jgi:pimeloyl-ACP methyl ester carboxylesterase